MSFSFFSGVWCLVSSVQCSPWLTSGVRCLVSGVFITLALFTCTNSYSDITTGLVGHWKLDEGSGGAASDSSGGGLNGALVNGPSWLAGKTGSSLRFDSASLQSVSMGNPAALKLNAFTIAQWVRPAAATNGSSFSYNGVDNAGNGGFIFNYKSGGNASFYVWTTGWNIKTVSYPPSNQWSHLVMTYSTSTDLIEVFVNGQSQGTAAVAGDISYTGVDNVFIGRYAYNAGTPSTSFFNGDIDDTRMYNRVLSPAEIAELYYQTGGARDGLVGWWTFDEGAGLTARDASGNRYHGDLTGHAPEWTVGKNGGALDFNGTYVATTMPSNTVTASFSISAWCNADTVAGTDSGKYRVVTRFTTGGGSTRAALTIDNGRACLMTDGGNMFGCQNIEANRWYHLVGVWTASGWVFYLDGAQVASGANLVSPADASSIKIGVGAGLARWFSGLIDDVRIYNRALSAEEVAAMYTETNGPVAGNVGAIAGVSSVRY